MFVAVLLFQTANVFIKVYINIYFADMRLKNRNIFLIVILSDNISN